MIAAFRASLTHREDVLCDYARASLTFIFCVGLFSLLQKFPHEVPQTPFSGNAHLGFRHRSERGEAGSKLRRRDVQIVQNASMTFEGIDI